MIRGVKIDKNRVMMEEGIAMEELNKKGRKKPWTGYDERGYNFSDGHMDWLQHCDDRWVSLVRNNIIQINFYYN